jgi:hydroxymethylpyrimidine pyrophosphatase-like HAD family hydrolase
VTSGNGWRPGLVVLDLDGTVVPYAEEHVPPSPRVQAAVASTLRAGVPVIIATGRAVWSALPTAADLGLHGVELVCSNGAVVYDPDSATVLHAVTIDPGPAARALTAGRPELTFAVEHGTEGFRTTPGFPRDFPSRFLDTAPLTDLVAAPTTRLVARVETPRPDEEAFEVYGAEARAARELCAATLDPAVYGWEIGYTGWIDVMAPGVTKATGAAMLAQDLGIDPADVLAVGDGENDLPLFAWAGRSVAMGQAPPDVRAAADEVTATVTHDGAAELLERWFG